MHAGNEGPAHLRGLWTRHPSPIADQLERERGRERERGGEKGREGEGEKAGARRYETRAEA